MLFSMWDRIRDFPYFKLGIRDFKAKPGEFRIKVCTRVKLPEITLGITGFIEIFWLGLRDWRTLLNSIPQHLGLSPLHFTNSVWLLKRLTEFMAFIIVIQKDSKRLSVWRFHCRRSTFPSVILRPDRLWVLDGPVFWILGLVLSRPTLI